MEGCWRAERSEASEAADFCDASLQRYRTEHDVRAHHEHKMKDGLTTTTMTTTTTTMTTTRRRCRPPSEPSEARRARRLTEYTWVHSGIKQGYIQVHSGTFRYIRDFSMTLPLTGDLGNRGKYKCTWVHSVQPPQPYILPSLSFGLQHLST